MAKEIKKKKIGSERLSRYITARDHGKAVRHLDAFYDSLLPKERQEIKEMFINNSRIENTKNLKYA